MDKLGMAKFAAGVLCGMSALNIMLAEKLGKPQVWPLHILVLIFTVWVFFGASRIWDDATKK